MQRPSVPPKRPATILPTKNVAKPSAAYAAQAWIA